MEGKRCPSCGEPLEEGMRFCPSCGQMCPAAANPPRPGADLETLYRRVKKAVMTLEAIDARRLERGFGLPSRHAATFLSRLQREGIVGTEPLPAAWKGSRGAYPVLLHVRESDEPALPVGAVRVPEVFEGELEERYQNVKEAITAFESTDQGHLCHEFHLPFYTGVKFLMRLQREGVVGKETLPPPQEEAGQPCRHGGYPVLTHRQAEGK